MIFKGSSQPKAFYESILGAVYGSNCSPGPEGKCQCQTLTFGLGPEEEHQGVRKQDAEDHHIESESCLLWTGEGNRSWE